MSLKGSLVKQLTLDEDKRKHVYKDSLGFFTIGVGRLVDSRKPDGGLRDDEISFMLTNDLDDRLNALHSRIYWFERLDDPRKGVLVNMSFQLGVDGLLKFRNTLELVKQGKFHEAADEMMDSTWARQTPNRAARLSEQMRSGVWQFEGEGKWL